MKYNGCETKKIIIYPLTFHFKENIMVKNYPFVGSHYFSENFKPQDLSLTYQHIQATQTPHFYNEVEFIFIVSGHFSFPPRYNLLLSKKDRYLDCSKYLPVILYIL